MISWRKGSGGALIGIVLAVFVTDAHALDPNRLLSQYVRGRWTSETGFAGGGVNGIAQTPDGYLWVGTDKGLTRFDGFNFRPVSFTPVPTASNVPVLQVLTDAGGKLWVRPQGAYLVGQKDLGFESISHGLTAITALSKDSHGGVLVSGIEQGIFHFTAEGAQKLGPSLSPVISMAEAADGKVWLGTLGDGLFFLTGGRAVNVNAGLPDRKINSLLPVGEDVWVGTDTGLYHGNATGFRRLQLPSLLGAVQVLSLLRDRDSNIWVGTTRGLLRINSKGISFSEENELRGDGGINVLFEDREGNLWIGGARGLGRLRDSAFVTYSSGSDQSFAHNGAVYVDLENRTWLAPVQGGLYVLQNGHIQPVRSIPSNEVVYSIAGGVDEVWAGRQRGGLTRLRLRNVAIESQSYTEANGLGQNSIYAVYETRDGSVWAGTLNGGVSKFKDGRFTTYTATNGLASNTISAILETRDGGMWFATPNGLSSFSNGQWRTYSTGEGLPAPAVNCLFEDSSGTLWSGTSAGLAFFASNHFQVPRESPDVLREPIVGMAEDKGGRFWIATSNHILRVPRDKLLGGGMQPEDIREYGQADGLESTEGVNRSRSVVSDSAGRIWFSLSSGLSVVNPSQIADDSVPALPHVEAITADTTTVPLAPSVRTPPSPRRITFDYTGLSLAVPGRIRFRYFLQGFDSSWSQPVAAREAVYTNLGPGSYRFRLIASNSEGLWNGPETAIALHVAPAFYQTYWFRLSCVAVLIALLWALHQWRVHHLRSQEKRLRDVVETIPAMTFTTRSNGSCTFVNKRWTEYTGLTVEETSGTGWTRAVHPEDLTRHSEKWGIAVATGEVFEDEARFRRAADGEYRWFLVRGVALRNQHGNIAKWYGTLTDIEDRKRGEQEREKLRQLEDHLAHINRVSMLGEMAASLAHEIKQPIAAAVTSANGCIEWLAHEPPNLDRARAAAVRIDKYGNRAAEIIDRIRSLYKKAPPQRELLDVNGIIQEMLTLLKGEAERYSVAMRTEVAAELPKIIADRVQLQQVFMNLMLNAIEAMEDEGGELKVKSELQDGQLQFSVSDTGVGLPMEKMDQIFSPFFTTKPQGSGMGLAISRSIVESHGGRLWATSNGRQGATFQFTLPVQVTESSPLVARGANNRPLTGRPDE